MNRCLATFGVLAVLSGCATTTPYLTNTRTNHGQTQACQRAIGHIATTGNRQMLCTCQGEECTAYYTPGRAYYHASGYGSGLSPDIASRAALIDAVGQLSIPYNSSQSVLCEPKGGWYECVVSVFWDAQNMPSQFQSMLTARHNNHPELFGFSEADCTHKEGDYREQIPLTDRSGRLVHEANIDANSWKRTCRSHEHYGNTSWDRNASIKINSSTVQQTVH